MSDKKFDLGDYVEVKDRIKLFYELYGQGRLVTGEVRLTNEPDGVPRVLVQGLAYRSPDDPLPGVGWSWMALPGTTTYTRGSELENTETSAWGRAIGSLGILIDKSIASSQEVQNKSGLPDSTKSAPASSVVQAEGGLIGIASLGASGPVDGAPRQTPDGMSVGFVIGEGREKVQVVAYGDKAAAFVPVLSTFMGQRVQVFGPVTTETMKVRGRDVTFPRVRLERLVTPDATFDFGDEVLPEPPDDVPLVGEAPALGLVG